MTKTFEFDGHVVSFDLHRCLDCDFTFVFPPLDPGQYTSILSHNASLYLDENPRARSKTDAGTIRLLNRFKPGGGALLDVGCSSGTLLREARGSGWDGVGVDASEEALTSARDTYGLNVYHQDIGKDGRYELPADIDSRRFDAVVLMWIISFVPDPIALLDMACRYLNSGGVILIGMPNIASPLARLMGRRWRAITPAVHTYLNPGCLQSILGKRGLETIHVNTSPVRYVSPRYLLTRMLGSPPEKSGKLPLGDLSLPLPLPLLDCVVMVGKKT